MRFLLPFVAVTSTAAPVGAQPLCRAFDAGEEVGAITDPRIDEASGLAASWANPGLLWTHNDSGDTARLFALDEAGEVRAVLTLGVDARDWEDMAIGPCPGGEACLFVGDIGDNQAARTDVTLHRLPEPVVPATATDLAAAGVESFVFTYEDGPRDAETLLVHPVSGAVYVVDKTTGDPNNVWFVPIDESPIVARKVASFDLGEMGVFAGRITGGDYAPDGEEIALRTYAVVYTFCGADPVAAFAAQPSRVVGFDLFQAETLTYARDGRSVWVTSEQRGTSTDPIPLVRMAVDEPVAMDQEPSADVAGPSPTDMTATGGADVRIVENDTPAPRGCSCANAKAEVPFGILGLLGILAAMGFRSSTRRR